MGRITAICVSDRRKTQKTPCAKATLKSNHGIEGDAHANPGNRQISLLSEESLRKMEAKGISTSPGCCGENIDVSDDIELKTLLPGVILELGKTVLLEITEIGKDNSDGHADNVIEGNIFPQEGVFAKVMTGGEVCPGDRIGVLNGDRFRAGVLTISDSTSAGEREDLSGPAVTELLSSKDYQVCRYAVVPDDEDTISNQLKLWSEDGSIDVLFTTGGTGFSPRDVTPEATCRICERNVPGIPEMIRHKSSKITESAWLSRATAGIHEKTLVINLPGSIKAATECAGFTFEILPHALEVLRGDVSRCGG